MTAPLGEYVPVVRSGFKPERHLNAVQLLDYRYRRRQRRECFGRSAKHTADKVYRCTAKFSRTERMSRTRRELLVRLVNLAIRRGYNANLPLSLPDLAKRGGMALNSARTAIRWIVGNGWAKLVRAGRGRGNVSVYRMDLPAMMRSLAPDLALTVGGEYATIEGETGALAKRCKNVGTYIRDKTQRWKSGGFWQVRYAQTIGFAESVVAILAGRAMPGSGVVASSAQRSEWDHPAKPTSGDAQLAERNAAICAMYDIQNMLEVPLS